MVLVDTHVLIWKVTGDDRLPDLVSLGIIEEGTEITVSVIVAWEICIKVKIGKLPDATLLEKDISSIGKRPGFNILPMSIDHVVNAGRLPLHHRDPFDRALIAQCLVEDIPIVSTDRKFDAYGVRRLWTDTLPGSSSYGFHEP